MLGLLSGRIINSIEGMELDFEKIFQKCLEKNVAIETCGMPDRLDLPAKYLRMARKIGVTINLSSGCRNLDEVENIEYALGQLRRSY